VSSPALETRALTKRFGDHIAVDSVTFDVGYGEVVGLLGANGAGKTTTIRMLVGLLEPSEGDARLLGAPPTTASQQRLGYVPQGLGLWGNLTVAENLAFSAAAYGVDLVEPPGRLSGVRDRLVHDLPLGLQRQLAFAIALQHEPEVLILDEPTSGVGPLGAARLWDQIRRESEGGAGVLVTTHSMQEAQQCDRLVLMADGKVVATGTEEDIIADMTAVEVTSESWTDIFTILAGAGSLVTLSGRAVRVIDMPLDTVERVLGEAGISATFDVLPATIDERMAAYSSPPSSATVG